MKSTYNTHVEAKLRFVSKSGVAYEEWVVVSVESLLAMPKDRRPSVRCPFLAEGCLAPVHLHKASTTTAAHFEHVARNPTCRFSDVYEGKITDIDWSAYPRPARRD